MGRLFRVSLVLFMLASGIGWGMNIVKLAQCNFASPYREEVLRCVGIVPPIGCVMGYLSIED